MVIEVVARLVARALLGESWWLLGCCVSVRRERRIEREGVKCLAIYVYVGKTNRQKAVH